MRVLSAHESESGRGSVVVRYDAGDGVLGDLDFGAFRYSDDESVVLDVSDSPVDAP